MTLPAYWMIDSSNALEECAARCRKRDAIAVDTEFVRTDTFYPLLGLIQISDGEDVWLVDPLAIDDLAPLNMLFSNANVIKVFHSCSEDLEVLRHGLGLIPVPLFDTQTAAAFLGYGYSRGYTKLVNQVLDVQLEQHETRSDWLQRPLSESQCHYASEDVYYLMKLYRKLVAELEQQGRSEWMREEMADLAASARDPGAIEDYYLKVKGAWKLSLQDLARLRELTSWREKEARDRDRPRNRVFPDQVLLEILRLKPASKDHLYSVKGLHPGQVRRYGDTLLQILGQEPDFVNLEPLPRPLDREERNLLSECRELINQKAESMGISPELLGRKKELEGLVRSQEAGEVALPEKLAAGWRYEVIGKELYSHVAKTAV